MKKTILSTNVQEKEIGLFYLGQVGFIFKFHKLSIMIDGFLTGDCWTPETVGNHYRCFPAPIQPEDLDFLDYVFFTHDHRDHTDPMTIKALLTVNDHCKFIAPAGFADRVRDVYGVPEERLIRAHSQKMIGCGEFSVYPVPAAHEDLHKDERGDYMELGYIFNFEGIRVFHGGDTCMFDGLEEMVDHTDLCMLPVNGRSYYRLKRNCIGNMNLEEAAIFASHVKTKLFIPLHYDMFPDNAVPTGYIPAGIDMWAPGLNFKMFKPGEKMIYKP